MNAFGLSVEEGTTELYATNNSWGDDSGPFHEELNPGGVGNAIAGNLTGAERAFTPWRDSAGQPVYEYIPDNDEDDGKYNENAIMLALMGLVILFLLWTTRTRPPFQRL